MSTPLDDNPTEPAAVISADPHGLSQELTCQPLTLVALMGLDPSQSTVHQTIWEAFSMGRRPDRPPMHFRLLPRQHRFPQPKPRKASYEWYVPKGILKTGWMHKHLYLVPAVATIFFDLDWGEKQWAERLAACAQEVQAARASLETRHTRLAVVLIQQSAPLPASEDPLAAERAASLCQSCDLPAKSLFVLPHSDHLQGYVARLENALYELAQAAYHQRIKRLKSHRDQLNKTIHVPLLVRHQFKAGFISELRQDPNAAHRHYAQAYAHLADMRASDTTLNEVRTVAGFLDYKMCQLAFRRNLPRDAVTQFQRHVDAFRNREGAPELAFEHQAWLAAQYTQFADLFDQAVKQGLVALQTQNPGFYYRQAAVYASARHRLCLKLCSENAKYPDPDPLQCTLEYYGQRPWRGGRLTLEPPDPVLERDGVLALQIRERQSGQHSARVVGLLSAAMAQFKRFRCPRMRRQLMVQMAQECHGAGEHDRALTLLGNALWDYRCERWWLLLTGVLELAIRCAYLTANVREYVVLAVEGVGPKVVAPAERKAAWWNNLLRVLALEAPEGDVDEEAQKKWDVSKSIEPITVELGPNAFIECKSTFDAHEAGKDVHTHVKVQNMSDHEIQFVRLSLFVTNPAYLPCCTIEAQSQLHFAPREVRSYSLEFTPEPQDYGQELQATAVVLTLGNTRQALLRVTSDTPSVRVAPRKSNVAINTIHSSPALVGELYCIKFEVENGEDSKAIGMKLGISVEDGGEDGSVSVFQDVPGDEPGTTHVTRQVGDLVASGKLSHEFYMRANREGTVRLRMQVDYTVEVCVSSKTMPCMCSGSTVETVVVKPPFQVTTRVLSMKFENLPHVYGGEAFVMSPEIMCVSPWEVTIESSCLDPSASFCAGDDLSSQVAGLCLTTGEVASECLCLQPVSTGAAILGSYQLKWRRVTNAIASTLHIQMPTVQVLPVPLSVDMDLPAHGWVRTPMPVSYSLRNLSGRPLTVGVTMEASDAFMFAGSKQSQLLLPPDSPLELSYNLYPLLAGFVALPQLRLALVNGGRMDVERGTDYQALLDSLLDRTLPSHVYIVPQAKPAMKSEMEPCEVLPA